MAEVACVLDCRDQLGESPVWCPIDQRLYWLDIKGQSISWLAPASGEYKQVPVDEQPGSLVLREQGVHGGRFLRRLPLLRSRDWRG